MLFLCRQFDSANSSAEDQTNIYIEQLPDDPNYSANIIIRTILLSLPCINH